MRGMLLGALWLLAGIVLAATVTAFAESYKGLQAWAETHRVPSTWRSLIWPLQVDTYILAGEIVLLVAAIRGWGVRARLLGWALTISGLTASTWWNAGHIGSGASIADHITAAVPPIAAVAGLMASLAVIKRLAAERLDIATSVPADVQTSRALDVQASRADGGITLYPVTPAARGAVVASLVADLIASVTDVTGALDRVGHALDAMTSRPQDVQTSSNAPRGTDGNDSDLSDAVPTREELSETLRADHDILMGLPSNAARVRAAAESLGGLDVEPARVAEWLRERGISVDIAYVRTALKRARRAAQEERKTETEAESVDEPALTLVETG